ncbi:MAG TPA: hypothetical protein PKA63_04915 [Oligoflexia bacterium]|nr:hypothetical protein [Oligoflexia bacterium]
MNDENTVIIPAPFWAVKLGVRAIFSIFISKTVGSFDDPPHDPRNNKQNNTQKIKTDILIPEAEVLKEDFIIIALSESLEVIPEVYNIG